MKKIFSMAAAIALTLSIGACSSEDEATKTQSGDITQESLTASITTMLEDTAESTYGIDAENIEPFAQCIATSAQDSLSESSLTDINSGTFPTDEEESKTFNEIMTTCSKEQAAPEEDPS